MEKTWMHPPGDLISREAVPETEVIMRLHMGWMHADPPISAPAPATEPDKLDQAAVKAMKRGARK